MLSTDSGLTDEVSRYAGLRSRPDGSSADGLDVLIVGELAFNPERVLALVARDSRGPAGDESGPAGYAHLPTAG
jgi:hypothetical protein